MLGSFGFVLGYSSPLFSLPPFIFAPLWPEKLDLGTFGAVAPAVAGRAALPVRSLCVCVFVETELSGLAAVVSGATQEGRERKTGREREKERPQD